MYSKIIIVILIISFVFFIGIVGLFGVNTTPKAIKSQVGITENPTAHYVDLVLLEFRNKGLIIDEVKYKNEYESYDGCTFKVNNDFWLIQILYFKVDNISDSLRKNLQLAESKSLFNFNGYIKEITMNKNYLLNCSDRHKDTKLIIDIFSKLNLNLY